MTSTTQTTSTTKTLARQDSIKTSIGHLPVGQDFFRLQGRTLKHLGSVVSITPDYSQGRRVSYSLVYTSPTGEQKTMNSGPATSFYVAKPEAEATPTKEATKASERSAKAMAPKKQTSTTPEATEPQVNLHQELVSQLKEAGIKVTPKWSPTKKYAAYKADNGKTLAYVFAQTSSGIKVKAGLELKELDRAAKKHWLDNSKEAPFSIRGFFTQANLGQAVEAIKATAAKQEAAKAAKAAKTTKQEPAPQPAPVADGLVTVSLPPAFYADHVARDLPAGTVVKQTKKAVTVALTPEELAELRSDASHYAHSMAEAGFEGRGLIASAKATLKALDKQVGEVQA